MSGSVNPDEPKDYMWFLYDNNKNDYARKLMFYNPNSKAWGNVNNATSTNITKILNNLHVRKSPEYMFAIVGINHVKQGKARSINKMPNGNIQQIGGKTRRKHKRTKQTKRNR